MDKQETVSVTFDETRIVDDHRKGTADEERFVEGTAYELSARSADRWVKRGVAHFTTEEDAAKAAGASSDVALSILDRDRFDPSAARTTVIGTGQAGGGQGGDAGAGAGGGQKPDYSEMKGPQLRDLIKDRGLQIGNATRNDQFIAILERDDVVTAAIEAKTFDALHVDELKDLAEKEKIDLTGKSTKTEIVEAFDAHYKAA
jgi:hypothetical protein